MLKVNMGQSEKQKEWKKEHYRQNKEVYNDKQRLRRQNIKKLVDSLKESCFICGENDKACIDFHHIDSSEKNFEIGDVNNHKWSDEKIINEIAKCICLCANHHRLLHYYNLTVDELKIKYKN
jgi:hypothetical protein